jgi:hypothetical protein
LNVNDRLMTPEVASIGTERVSFLNRDHIDSRSPDRSVASPCDQCSLPGGVPARHVVLVTIDHGEIVVISTTGREIRVPASPATIAKFADELANDIQSNFVSIRHSRPPNRFVDDGPEFISVVESKT